LKFKHIILLGVNEGQQSALTVFKLHDYYHAILYLPHRQDTEVTRTTLVNETRRGLFQRIRWEFASLAKPELNDIKTKILGGE